MVRKLALFLVPILLILSSCLNQGGVGDTSAAGNDVDGANIVILSPNGGQDFTTKLSASVVVSGTCAQKEMILKTTPSRPIVNNCAIDGTWHFETGQLYAGHNRISVQGVVRSDSVLADQMDELVGVNNDGGGPEFDINVLVSEFRILINRSPVEVGDTMKVRAAFYDSAGVELLVNPEATRGHSFSCNTWHNSIAAFDPSPVTGTVMNIFTLTGIEAGDTFIECMITMNGYTGAPSATKEITVIGGAAPLTCEQIWTNTQNAALIPDCPTASSSLDDYIAGECDGDIMLYKVNFETYSAIGTCAMTCEQRQEFVYIYLNPMIRDLAKAGAQMSMLASDSSCYDVCVETRAYYMSIPGVPPVNECTAP